MSILGLLPLLLATSAAEVPLDMARWQACRQESSPLVRLACYDAIGNEAASAAEGAAPKSAAWQAIWAQEQARTPESAPFLLQSDAGHMDDVRGLACCARDLPGARCSGPIEADHAGLRPLGRKADDDTCIPLDRQCHRDRTDLTGPFRGWSRAQMRTWLDDQIANTRSAIGARGGAA